MPRSLIVLALLTVAAAPAAPAAASPDSDLCLFAAQSASQLSGVPLDVLLAVSLTETAQDGAPWPWTVNLEGDGHWFATRDEALAFAEAARAAGRTSFDVGCFQVNWRWHGDAFTSVAQAFDPLANATYAAHLMAQGMAETGDWSAAAGQYHSRTPEHASRYRAIFDRHLADLRANGVPQPVQVAALASGPLPARRVLPPVDYPLLREGEGASTGSLVPAASGARLLGAAPEPLLGG